MDIIMQIVALFAIAWLIPYGITSLVMSASSAVRHSVKQSSEYNNQQAENDDYLEERY